MNITSSDENISDDELTNDSILSLETGLPKIYRNNILKIDLSSSDDEIVEIMSNNESCKEILSNQYLEENNTQEEIINISDDTSTRTMPIQDTEKSSSEHIINQLSQSTTIHECVICLDGNNDKELIHNKLCDCVYAYHAECYYDWIKNSRKNTCILCKKPTIKSSNNMTNIRLLNILKNVYKQNSNNFIIGQINIIEIDITDGNQLCSHFIIWVYNYNLEYLEKIVYLIFFIWLILLVLLIIESVS